MSADFGLVLGIDTVAARAGIALASQDQVLAVGHADSGERARGEFLAAELSRILEQLSKPPSAIEAIAVVNGPGSFTGVRVGLALARGLAFAQSLPTVGVGSLEALVASCEPATSASLAVLSAGRGKVYVAAFDQGLEVAVEPFHGELDPSLTPGLRDWAEGRKLRVVCETLDVGEGLLGLLVSEGIGLEARLCEAPAARAGVVASLGALRLARGEGVQATAVLPAYLAESSARPNRNGVLAGR